MSLDGKIVGDYLPAEIGMASQRAFWELGYGPNRQFREHKGWLSGRVTTEDNFTHYAELELDVDAAPVPEGDYLAVADAPMHYCPPTARQRWTRRPFHSGTLGARKLHNGR